MLSKARIEDLTTVLMIATDPASPFYDMVSLGEILDLPLADQIQLYNSLPDRVRGLVDAYKERDQ